MGCENLDALKREGKEEELRNWASFRGQTLRRTGEKLQQYLQIALYRELTNFMLFSCMNTVRGMMYCRDALKLQAFLDMADDEGLPS